MVWKRFTHSWDHRIEMLLGRIMVCIYIYIQHCKWWCLYGQIMASDIVNVKWWHWKWMLHLHVGLPEGKQAVRPKSIIAHRDTWICGCQKKWSDLIHHFGWINPSGKRTWLRMENPYLTDKSTISMAIFTSYVSLPEHNHIISMGDGKFTTTFPANKFWRNKNQCSEMMSSPNSCMYCSGSSLSIMKT